MRVDWRPIFVLLAAIAIAIGIERARPVHPFARAHVMLLDMPRGDPLYFVPSGADRDGYMSGDRDCGVELAPGMLWFDAGLRVGPSKESGELNLVVIDDREFAPLRPPVGPHAPQVAVDRRVKDAASVSLAFARAFEAINHSKTLQQSCIWLDFDQTLTFGQLAEVHDGLKDSGVRQIYILTKEAPP
jgi:hypothetical protein